MISRNRDDERLSRVQDAEFQKKLDSLKAAPDPAKEAEIEARIAQHEATTKRAAQAMRQDSKRPALTNPRKGTTRQTGKRATGRHRKKKDKPSKPTGRELFDALVDALKAAETNDDRCAAVTEYAQAKMYHDTQHHQVRKPSWSTLVAWWRTELPRSIDSDAAALLSEAVGRPSSYWAPWPHPTEGTPTPTFNDIRGFVPTVTLSDSEHERGLLLLDIAEYTKRWLALPDPRPRFALIPVIDHWLQNATESVGTVSRPNPIMPRNVAMVEPTAERYYLTRFRAAAHREPNGQLLLGFKTEGERGPTLPANIWTMGLRKSGTSNSVVSLALRIWVASILHTPLHARHGLYPVELQDMTLRKFLRWLYIGERLPAPIRYWKPILEAREAIHENEIPFTDSNGNLWGRQVVRLDNPYTRPGLDDPWPVVVHLPPGDGSGPSILFSRLQYWGTRNPACYRALINLSYRWHIEGKRLMPTRRGKHWLHRRTPKLYDKLTDADKEALCFPPGTGAKRRDQRIADANVALEELVRKGDATAVGERLLPPSA